MTKIDGGLADEFRSRLPGIHFQRIETGGTGRGIPDTTWAATGGKTGWLEYKQTDGWAVTLMPEQVGWILRRSRLGSSLWIAVRRKTVAGKRRGASCDELYMIPGEWAALAKDGGIRGLLPLLRPDASGLGPWVWSGGPGRWDWGQVRGLMLD